MSLEASSARTERPVRADQLRVGDRVRVKDREEILATLSPDGTVDGLPFMPEMLAFAGQTIPVDAVAHRTCDTVKSSGTSGTTRRMPKAVHLRDVRCDGSSHGGCQAQCLIFWKEEWLESAPDDAQASTGTVPSPTAVEDVPTSLAATTHGYGHTDDDPVFSCQATRMLEATSFVSPRRPGLWISDVRSGNARAGAAMASLAVLAFNKWQGVSRRLPGGLRIRDGQAWPWYVPSGERRRYPTLDLQPGELVEVRSRAEIEATLDANGALRGLRFGAEMLPYCGTRARVLARVDRIIDEQTGRMLRLRDCIILEDVWCQGTFRALCRRKIYTYWREAWLRRVDQPPDTTMP